VSTDGALSDGKRKCPTVIGWGGAGGPSKVFMGAGSVSDEEGEQEDDDPLSQRVGVPLAAASFRPQPPLNTRACPPINLKRQAEVSTDTAVARKRATRQMINMLTPHVQAQRQQQRAARSSDPGG
jgi:hypothetical protein